MRRRLFPLLSILLLAGFFVYANSSIRLHGSADKAVQLFTIFPAVLLFGLSGHNPFRKIVEFVASISTGLFLLSLSLLVLAFMIYMSLVPFEGIPKGGDEAAYLFQSKIFAAGELTAPEPSVANPRSLFPFRHFIFRNDEWFVMYTPLHSILMAPFTAVGTSWLLGPLESLLSLLGAFLLMRRLAGDKTARLGVFVMAISPFFLFMGSTHMAHNTSLMLVTWALFYLVKGVQENRYSGQLVCGLLLGLALNTKPYPIIPWSFTIIVVLFAKLKTRAFAVILRIAAGAVLPVLFFLFTNYRYSGDAFSPAYNLARGGGLIGFGEHKAWFPEYGDHTHTPLRGMMNLLRQAGAGSTILLGWPLLSLLPAMAVIFDRKVLKKTWPLYLSILLIAPFLIFHYAAAIAYGPRHYYTTLPSFALLTAVGITVLIRKWKEKAFVTVAGLFLVSTLMIYLPDGIRLRSGPWQAIDSIPMSLAEQTVDPPAVVFMEASEHGYPNILSGLLATDPFLRGDIIFCAHQTTAEDRDHINGIFLGRNPYLFHDVGSEFVIEEWSDSLSELLTPERELMPDWAPENLPEAGN